MAVPGRDEVETWSDEERAEMARALDAVITRPVFQRRNARVRRLVLGVTIGGAALLVPWVVYLSLTLPRTQSGGAWRLVWVGFDIALAGALAFTGWLAWHRRQVVLVGLVVSATLVVTDAWFDVCLSWNSPEQAGALASAVLIEIPVALLLSRAALIVMRRSAQTVALLRGQSATTAPLWRQPIILAPPPRVANPRDPLIE